MFSLDANKSISVNTEHVQTCYVKLFYSVFFLFLTLDSSSPSLFSLSGICDVDHQCFLSTAQFQIDFLILSQSTDFTVSHIVYGLNCCSIVRKYIYMRSKDMVTQWSEPKEICLKFHGINVHEDLSFTKLPTRESNFKSSSPTSTTYQWWLWMMHF